MTVLKYIIESKICNTAELLQMKREWPEDWAILQNMAREEMVKNGIEVTEK